MHGLHCMAERGCTAREIREWVETILRERGPTLSTELTRLISERWGRDASPHRLYAILRDHPPVVYENVGVLIGGRTRMRSLWRFRNQSE